jgi:uncharacterized protein YjiS (DUF1127 family)
MRRKSIARNGADHEQMENVMQSRNTLALGPGSDLSGALAFERDQNSGLSKFVALIKSKLAAIETWQRQKEMIDLLHQLDDHVLADIGIRRHEIETAVRNSQRANSAKAA